MPSLLRRLYGPVLVEGDIAASPSEVFGVLSDPETYPDWLVGAANIRGVDPAFPDAGSEFEHSVGTRPVSVDDRTESMGAERDHRLTLLVHVGPFHGRVQFTLDALRGKTHVVFTEQPVGALAVLTPVLRPSLHARNRKSLQQLGDFVESAGALAHQHDRAASRDSE